MRVATATLNQLRSRGRGLFSASSSFSTRMVAPLERQQHRSISMHTDMLSSVITLQAARPWSMSESNLASDHAITLKELFADKRVVLFGVPAPFTGTCSLEHYPGYQELAVSMKEEHGVDEIVCYAVADPYAHHGWSQALKNNNDHITFLADPDATFAKAYGVDAVYDEVSLGQRSTRFSMVVDDGQVVLFRTVTDNAKDDAKLILEGLEELNEA
mmetsp:Transcript_5272/g.11643  ORF Transcript_5272/g.11643 Transcript_5272/m.11643 type:complete len:215 (-) Transcript_5272:100-744(-)